MFLVIIVTGILSYSFQIASKRVLLLKKREELLGRVFWILLVMEMNKDADAF